MSLARLRRNKGYSQRTLAQAAEVSPSTIWEIEAGRHSPNPSTLRKLAGALNITPEKVMEAIESPKESAPLSERVGGSGALLRVPFNARTAEFYGAPDERLTEEQRAREGHYGPLRDYVNDRLERWEQKAEAGNFDRGSADEFHAELERLVPYLAEMERREILETPPEERGENNRNLILNQPIWRLIDALPKLKAAYEAKLTGSDLEQLKRRSSSVEDAVGSERERIG
jgi:transcriptional regulator with XRE-family HTH domain